ncbi:glucuronoxylan 4-O-methyltransferase 1-like [Iris pallida]|uniref:Glucuronoxylan 4-O-methyltransferase 1-like n=1 Tax=Iris pallida TaxID=29817 RepID=A0AAX6DU88_IRIPA|nr:glucuronoxylan 4-O-methyltransferase 1-like [Iris pallida]KAJ6795324.1 glucuronoxylan 4-O-methyltransferase 1-like [Iris pallida]KAJ6795325.1 glucuronoxylan 4-O-methyltransferase 1-like [Iris pallida]KAJ6813283.1 glucuronoxylan 4-O-methyltransferase 1-like [Iris pallida]
MRSFNSYRVHNNTFNPKFPLVLGFLLLLLFVIVFASFTRSNTTAPTTNTTTTETISPATTTTTTPNGVAVHSCTKIPSSLVDTILHYATSNTTPQQTLKEISVTARVLKRRSPCNFLVFGLGHDSLMWAALNHGGRTVFLEEDASWIETIRAKFPTLESYHVKYDTRVAQAEELMELGRRPECSVVGDVKVSGCRLALRELPELFYETEWDMIMVDAPTGWIPEAPGRMGAIYTAGMAARGRKEGETDVFVHDVDRIVEDKFSREFLCEGYMKEQEGRLRHFTIPSHKANLGMPFCPGKEE